MENSWWFFLAAAAALIVLEGLYFKIADHYNIIDRPNGRSSHTVPIIRGGGIIFLFGALIWFFLAGFQWPWFMMAIFLIAVISFLDDVTSLSAVVRFAVQAAAILLVIYQLWPLPWPWYLIAAAFIVTLGTLNAFNFMDGINGITGVYALVMLATFAYLQFYVVSFTDLPLIGYVSLSIVVFLYFNFRTRARCFAGDVGSVTMALILVFLLLQLVVTTGNFLWPLLFLVYGVDSIITILYRLKRKENIFKPHRTHLFQYLSNEKGIPHLVVSLGYGILQGLLNIVLVFFLSTGNLLAPLLVALLFLILYVVVRTRVVQSIHAPAS